MQVDKTLTLMTAAFTRLASIQDDGPQYVAALKAHFREEHHWMRWKCKPKLSSPANTITADFVKQPCEALSEDVESETAGLPPGQMARFCSADPGGQGLPRWLCRRVQSESSALHAARAVRVLCLRGC